MNFQRRDSRRGRAGRSRVFRVESLEQRALLAPAAETFHGPSLENLIVLARHGKDTALAAIHRMLNAFETQLTSGPLADLQNKTVTGDEFVTEVQRLESSYEQNVNAQLFPEFPNVDRLLILQGQRIVADESSLNQQATVGLLTPSAFVAQAETAINSLTAGPLHSLHTPLSGYATATQNFEAGLSDIAAGLTVMVPLTPAEASATMLAETVAYQADMHAALQVTHPHISHTVDQAVASLMKTANAIAAESAAAAQAQINSAITTFDTAILDETGVFGPRGVIAISLATGRGFAPHLGQR
jgi:hypothetical protein